MKSKTLKSKTLIVLIFFAITMTSLFAQKQNFERATAIELKERADFYHVDNRNNFLSDTIFYSYSGFRVNPNYGIHKVGDTEYVVLTYPSYKGKTYQQDSIQKMPPLTKDVIDSNGVHIPIRGKNGRRLMIEKTIFESLNKTVLYSTKWNSKSNYRPTTGLLTVPFKLRPQQDSTNFSLTTDVTLGPYFGITKRISKRQPFYITIPATLGLSFININDNTTSNEFNNDKIGVVPGVTWSSGLVFQLDNFNLGFVFGKDYASGIGKDWIYQGKTWYSFAIGYNFLSVDAK